MKPDVSETWARVVPAKSQSFTVKVSVSVKRTITDLSDHYPIFAHFVYPDMVPVHIQSDDLDPLTLHAEPKHKSGRFLGKLIDVWPYILATLLFILITIAITMVVIFAYK